MINCENKTAVVILNWNGREMMRRFLPAVVRHAAGEAVVIVADNGSTDGSLAMLEAEFPEVERLPLPENYGYAEGYNRALAQIAAPYYLLLNSDVETTPGWLAPLRRYMDAHPRCAACQPKLLDLKAPERFEYAGGAGGYLDRYGYPFCRGRVFASLEKDRGQYDAVAPLFWATGAALMVRAEAWRTAGGLDGRFFAHMEEVDLCWRLRARGHDIVCIPESRVFHLGGATLSAENPRKTFLNFRNNLLMLYKNLPEADLRPVMRLRFWLDLLASLQFLACGRAGDFKAVWRARRAYRRMRPDFLPQRLENLRLQTGDGHFAEWLQGSILWQHYALGRKTFAQIKW